MSDFTKRFGGCLLLMCFGVLVIGQDYPTLIRGHLESLKSGKPFESADVSDLLITDSYEDVSTGLHYVYAQQRIDGLPIENAILNFVFKKNTILVSNSDRLVVNVISKLNKVKPLTDVSNAVITALNRSTGPSAFRAAPKLLHASTDHHYKFEKPTTIQEDIPAQLLYKLDDENKLILYWKVGIHEASGDYWNNYIHAETGTIDLRINMTLSCFSPGHSTGSNQDAAVPNPVYHYLPMKPPAMQYRVWALPLSAPNAGSSTLVTDPSDPLASPLGWHDDGTTKYTHTQGNNTHAFADLDTNNISSNDEPNGGASLIFDFPYDPNGTIASNKNAAVVNLFYMNNIMHDFAYQYGFTEEAGNFQAKNISGKGKGNDRVIALAQYGATSSRYRNNADFLAPEDGTNGRMRMFVWNVTGSKLLRVSEPASLSTDFETGTADFGPQVSQIPLTGKLVLVSDGTSTPTLGCKTFTNAASVKGKIAIIDRGDCFFQEKACFAQAAGAIGVILCNYENTPITMGSVSPVPCTVNIPVLSVGSVDGNFLKQNINIITVVFQAPVINGSLEKDGSFDNGIIAHEYGHGISIRLAGGPSISSCLNNDEQMGEGWSDFFALVTTVKPGDSENTTQGIGTFPIQQAVSGRGIRKFPYTLDFAINDQTYEDILSTETPHSLGEVWALMLWELYWSMTKTYGWDPDLYRGNGGNNKAIRLVFEGLRLQPCNPGFVNGRDAILKADELLNSGQNQCIIWQAFARRGLGFSAKQGSTTNRSDGVQAFDLPPFCIPTVKISKSMTPSIKAGEDIQVSLVVRNDRSTAAKNVVITDLVPAGASYKTNSSNVNLTVDGPKLTYKHAQLLPGESISIVYTLQSSKTLASKTIFIDSMENSEFNYDVFSLKGSGIWELTDVVSRSGKKSWFVPNQSSENDQLLNLSRPIEISDISKPVLRFYHRYNIQHAFDGGILRVSTNDGFSYSDLGSKIFRNGYNGPLSYFAIPLPELRAFYGDSKTFIPTYVDLHELVNQQINLQFRFGSNDSRNATGWFIDDLEIMDMFNYNSEACVTADSLEVACAEASEKGTIVEPQLTIPNREENTIPLKLELYPNPASDLVYCTINLPKANELLIKIVSLDGRLIKSFKQPATGNQMRLSISTADMTAGMYFIHIQSGAYLGREKLVIQR